MTEEEALRVLTPLAVAFPFGDDQVELWETMLKGLSQPALAMKTTTALINEHEGFRAPAWAQFKKQYDRFYARWEEDEAEKRLQLESGGKLGGGVVPPREGRQIAAAAYAKMYGRTPPADVFALLDPERPVTCTPEEVEKALSVIRGGYEHDGMVFSSYVEVLRAFGGHQATARAAVAQLEGSKRVVHRPNGQLILLRRVQADVASWT